jgi:hypothetical protein
VSREHVVVHTVVQQVLRKRVVSGASVPEGGGKWTRNSTSSCSGRAQPR